MYKYSSCLYKGKSMKKFASIFLLIVLFCFESSRADNSNVSIDVLIDTYAKHYNVHPYVAAISLGCAESTQWLIEQKESLAWLQNHNGSNRGSDFHQWLISMQEKAVYSNRNYELSNFLSKVTSYVVAFPLGMNGYLFYEPVECCH